MRIMQILPRMEVGGVERGVLDLATYFKKTQANGINTDIENIVISGGGRLIKELEKDLGREINFTILKESEFRYREDIMDIFLYNILEGKTLILLDNLHKTK